MAIELMSPVGRLVQGGISLEKKIDPQTNKPKLDTEGKEILECYISLAVAKTDPGVNAFIGAIVAEARKEFPHLFDTAGNCVHPSFAFKVQDGDGRDSNGKSVAEKPGFAGHWIFKMASRYLPKCFHEGRFDPAQQIQNPAEIIKRGYYIRVSTYVSGNGVKPTDTQKKPGIFLSPSIVSLVGYGEEIQGGPDAQKVFAAAGAPIHLPAGMSATPVAGSSAPAGVPALPGAGGLPALPGAVAGLPALPGAGAAPVPALPGVAAVPALPGLPGVAAAVPALPGVAVAHVPVLTMTPKAQGATVEAMRAQGWTDELMIQHGYAVMQ